MLTFLTRNTSRSLALLGILGGLGSSLALLPAGSFLSYQMTSSDGEIGQATAVVESSRLSIKVRGAHPNSLYTVWVDFKSRFMGTLSLDYPDGAIERGVAPAFSTTQGVTSGMGLDANAFVTDGHGNADFTVALDYNLLDGGSAPVVFGGLSMQGPNRVGGQWMRVYEGNGDGAELQVTDATTGLPLVQRATAAGLTIVRHPDKVSHGMTPGVGDVDHVPGFSGDFPRGFRLRAR
ncbi:MAG: hypothetical protein KDB80_07255 [Planctomycetes bacterium]|nr:hypothetical protein [Planctomycetota bacterium]